MPERQSRSYLQLSRFPLVFTVWSDVLMGYFLGASHAEVSLSGARLALMLAVTTSLYTGAMTLCDCFEYESDREHGHPGPLPVGVMSVHGAYSIGFLLVLLALAGATLVSSSAGLLSVAVALLLLAFSSWTRGLPFVGAGNLAVVRGATVLLGMGFAHTNGVPVPSMEYWGPPAAVVAYVFLATQIAAEEEHPRRERLLRVSAAVIVLLVVLHVLLYVSPLSRATLSDCIFISVFVLGTVVRLGQLARRAVRELSAESVQKLEVAVLVGMIVLNANFVAFAGTLVPTLGVLFLLVPTFLLLRFFHLLYPGTRTAMD